MAKRIDGEFTERIIGWYRENRRDLPWRKDREPYHVWVSEIMLQQTRAAAVCGYYQRFMEALPTVKDLAEAEEETLLKLWQGLGYYNRVRNLQKAAQVIQQNPCAAFPDSVQGLLALPGIGEYTAGAIASICFDRKAPAVDGNVLRVMARLRNDPQDIKLAATKREVAAFLAELYPEGTDGDGYGDGAAPAIAKREVGRTCVNPVQRREPGGTCKAPVQRIETGACGDFTQALIELGALVCVPNGPPQCSRCPVAEFCQGREAGTTMGLPVKGEKKPRRREERTVFILTCGDKVAVRKRSEGSLLEGLYEFPGTFQHLTAAEAVSQAEAWGCRPVDLVRSARYKHVFTHVEWDMVGYYITCAAEGSGIAGETDRPKAAPELDAKGQPSGHGTAAKGQPSGHGAEEAGRQQAGFRWASSQEMEHEIPLPSAFGYFWNN